MKTLTMSEFRKEPGEYILDVVRDHESYRLTKAGRPVADLTPISDIVIERDGTIRGELPLTLRQNLGSHY